MLSSMNAMKNEMSIGRSSSPSKREIKLRIGTISGSVMETGKRLGIPTPYHEMVVSLIHAMENRNRTQEKS